jgi:hypothetical protein
VAVLAMTVRGGFEDGLAAAIAVGGRCAAQRICELCVANLAVTGAAITAMTSANEQDPVWATDEVAARIDELQFRLAEGPCVQAFESGLPVLVADIGEGVHERWPVFAVAAARETPARGMYVFPLLGGELSLGVLDFYRDQPGMLAPEDLARAQRASDTAFLAVLGLSAHPTGAGTGQDENVDSDTDAWLGDPPLERPEVYQATGMIIAQLEVSPDVALARLRAYAFAHDRPIDAVARDVVARTLRFTEDPSEEQ